MKRSIIGLVALVAVVAKLLFDQGLDELF